MKRAVIIGAGPAGITAAYEILKRDKNKDWSVIVLEESNCIGGISRTVHHQGNCMDMGGHRFFSKDEGIMQWWRELMPIQGSPSFDDERLQRQKQYEKNGPDPEKADEVMLLRQRVSRIYYKNKFFAYPISLNFWTLWNMGVLQTLRVGISYLYSCIHKLPEDSLENFYINRFGRILYKMFFEGYTEKLWGRAPKEISADWGAQRVKGLSILAVLKDAFCKLIPNTGHRSKETSLIEEFYYPKYGPGQLWEKAAQEIEHLGGTIIKNAKVMGIKGTEARLEAVTYQTASGEEHTIAGDCFFSSMPMIDLVASFGSVVPKEIKRISDGLPYRAFVTIGLLVPKLKIRNQTKIATLNNIVPDCWIYVQDDSVKLGRIQIFNNWSPYLVKDPENTVWIGLEYFCNEEDAFWNLPEEAAVQLAKKELIQIGILQETEEILCTHREKVKKAYPAYFDTYAEIGKLQNWLDQYENLYCIGRNGQHRYNNMDHSMATAIVAVKQMLSGEKQKDSIWNINTEKAYHESKQD